MPIIPRDELLEILREVKEKLKEVLGDNLVEVILFGSYARGKARNGSDVDVLVVVRRWPSIEELDRIGDLSAKLTLKYGVLFSLLPYVKKPSMKRDPLIWNVEAEGVEI
ncbi:nucleotidyltransferase domain-containing protein [Thermococcus sp.]|uniref:nucleotidyltransferase domain-containing protein n=1 Tax=Thermococcus sp. TaxID=35749 RepID=UPI00261E4D7A|nr:nucleotidyltransferase domain-containing protein [Thermococcus sp.]